MFSKLFHRHMGVLAFFVGSISLASAQGVLDAALPKSDVPLMMAAAEKLYKPDNIKVGTVESWSNAETGDSGSVKLVHLHAYKGLPCRRLEHTIRLKGETDPLSYVVDRCKAADGSWKLLF